MTNKQFERKTKEDKPVLAICYDFDKTLSPDDMQAQGYIQSVKYDVLNFWKESNGLAEENDMDQNLAYMYKMMQEARGTLIFNRKTLNDCGSKVKLFPGVEEWFERIREYGKNKDVIIEHYIISSGLKEIIEGTTVARKGAFEKIYASSYYFDDRDMAVWPAQVVNYTNKTQFLFRISKGVLDINDQGVNDYFSPEEVRVPFRNIVYIGDSDTDIPCMKLVNSRGGHSIGVYNADTQDKVKVYKMMRDNRIKFFVSADYSEGTELDVLVKSIIDRTATNEALESIHYKNKKEYIEADRMNDEENKKKMDLIIALENSNSFANTHTIIKSLNSFTNWSNSELEMLMNIAIENTQVFCILKDYDVRMFYKRLLKSISCSTINTRKVKEIVDSD
ncbi:MAG: haloacid dehalogenase-like hydrolase [Lachnospiraceae bacterium]|nr:haloacid dehalogenase-like hydrolase [Lachnospiraceae bacterium]